ncbi:MAG: alpha/beta hydrolase [Pirellulales bacterium]
MPYGGADDKLRTLDVYAPADAKAAPIVFWIHGGGWQTGDKAQVQLKPEAFNARGYVFVSANYRLLPDVPMETIVGDVAKALAWTHGHALEYGGDPKRIVVAGHSAGAQLAALLCTDGKYLKNEGIPLTTLRGCIPVDGDTYDISAIIETAETRRRVHGQPQATFGHREKFGNDAKKHVDFSAVTHVAKNKGIPPFLILYVADHPDNAAQAQRFGEKLKAADVPVTLYGAEGNQPRPDQRGVRQAGRSDDEGGGCVSRGEVVEQRIIVLPAVILGEDRVAENRGS